MDNKIKKFEVSKELFTRDNKGTITILNVNLDVISKVKINENF